MDRWSEDVFWAAHLYLSRKREEEEERRRRKRKKRSKSSAQRVDAVEKS